MRKEFGRGNLPFAWVKNFMDFLLVFCLIPVYKIKKLIFKDIIVTEPFLPGIRTLSFCGKYLGKDLFCMKLGSRISRPLNAYLVKFSLQGRIESIMNVINMPRFKIDEESVLLRALWRVW